MTKDESIKRAQRAKALLEDDILKEAFDHIEAEWQRLFREVAPEDISALQQVKFMQYTHQKYVAFLKRVIANGAIEKMSLEEKRPRPPGY